MRGLGQKKARQNRGFWGKWCKEKGERSCRFTNISSHKGHGNYISWNVQFAISEHFAWRDVVRKTVAGTLAWRIFPKGCSNYIGWNVQFAILEYFARWQDSNRKIFVVRVFGAKNSPSPPFAFVFAWRKYVFVVQRCLARRDSSSHGFFTFFLRCFCMIVHWIRRAIVNCATRFHSSVKYWVIKCAR